MNKLSRFHVDIHLILQVYTGYFSKNKPFGHINFGNFQSALFEIIMLKINHLESMLSLSVRYIESFK